MPIETHRHPATGETPPAGEAHSHDPHHGQNADGLRARAQRQARELKENVKHQAKATAEHWREAADDQIQGQQRRWSDVLRGYGDAAQAASDEIQDDPTNVVGPFFSRVAEGCHQAGDYLDERNVREMAADAGDLVRRHPGVAFGVAFGAGFLLSRLMLAAPAPSGHSGDSHHPNGGHHPDDVSEDLDDEGVPQSPYRDPMPHRVDPAALQRPSLNTPPRGDEPSPQSPPPAHS